MLKEQLAFYGCQSLNERRLRDHLSLLPPFGFFFALHVGGTLACGDLVEDALFRFPPHVGVPRESSA